MTGTKTSSVCNKSAGRYHKVMAVVEWQNTRKSKEEQGKRNMIRGSEVKEE